MSREASPAPPAPPKVPKKSSSDSPASRANAEGMARASAADNPLQAANKGFANHLGNVRESEGQFKGPALTLEQQVGPCMLACNLARASPAPRPRLARALPAPRPPHPTPPLASPAGSPT